MKVRATSHPSLILSVSAACLPLFVGSLILTDSTIQMSDFVLKETINAGAFLSLVISFLLFGRLAAVFFARHTVRLIDGKRDFPKMATLLNELKDNTLFLEISKGNVFGRLSFLSGINACIFSKETQFTKRAVWVCEKTALSEDERFVKILLEKGWTLEDIHHFVFAHELGHAFCLESGRFPLMGSVQEEAVADIFGLKSTFPDDFPKRAEDMASLREQTAVAGPIKTEHATHDAIRSSISEDLAPPQSKEETFSFIDNVLKICKKSLTA